MGQDEMPPGGAEDAEKKDGKDDKSFGVGETIELDI